MDKLIEFKITFWDRFFAPVRGLVFGIGFITCVLIACHFVLWEAILVFFCPVLRKGNLFRKPCLLLYNFYLNLIGIKVEFRGLHNLPSAGCVLLSKHSSMIETIIFPIALDISPVAKKSLRKIPLWNLLMWRIGCVVVDRDNRTSRDLFSFLRCIRNVVDCGKKVVLFPEGTRVMLGQEVQMKLAILRLYPDVPFVPVALNTSTCFGKGIFSAKYPGKLIMEFMPPLSRDLPFAEAKVAISAIINSNSRRLENEFIARYNKRGE